MSTPLDTYMVTIFDEPKIDCHNHLLDPAHFGYAPNAWYHPVANEQGTAHQLTDLFNAYGCRHALVVGPNSGYDTDNRCLLDFLDQGNGRFRGVAVVDNDISRSELERLRDREGCGKTLPGASSATPSIPQKSARFAGRLAGRRGSFHARTHAVCGGIIVLSR